MTGSNLSRAPRPRTFDDALLPLERACRGLVAHRLEVPPREVVFVKSIVEASEGLASIFAESGGSLTIASPIEREAALRELLADLAHETGGAWLSADVRANHTEVAHADG